MTKKSWVLTPLQTDRQTNRLVKKKVQIEKEKNRQIDKQTNKKKVQIEKEKKRQTNKQTSIKERQKDIQTDRQKVKKNIKYKWKHLFCRKNIFWNIFSYRLACSCSQSVLIKKCIANKLIERKSFLTFWERDNAQSLS